MGINLFDDFKRIYDGPADYSESYFKYLNRSARAHYKNARVVLETWFKEYCNNCPDSAKDLRKRFRSKSNEHHFGAITELYVHNLLLKNGYKEIKSHPELQHTTTHPEFLVSKDSKPLFFIEVVVVFGRSDNTLVEKFEASIFDAMNKVESRDFLVSIKIEQYDKKIQPSIGKIKKCIKEKLISFDYKKICEQIETGGGFPEWYYRENGWNLKFTASPVKETARSRRSIDSRIIGAIQYPVKHIGLDEDIKRTILGKLKKYGDLGIPFIVAVNVISEPMFCDDYSIMCALFGKETVRITNYKDGTQSVKPSRTMDGIIVHPKKGVKYTRMSGLLVLPYLTGSTLDKIKPVLWHHPKPKYPFDPNLLKIAHKVHNPKTGKMEEVVIT